MYKVKIVFFFMVFVFLFSCQNAVQKKPLTPEDQAKYITKGKLVSGLSFKALAGAVTKALNEGGVQHAVEFCHLNASPIIDSLSMHHQVKIHRVSDKVRNPLNKPDKLDLEVLLAYQEQMKAGIELQPHLEVTADDIIFYSPILILNPVCLNCHGEPGLTAEQENIDFIKTKYPDDMAVGYKIGNLRGLWKITIR